MIRFVINMIFKWRDLFGLNRGSAVSKITSTGIFFIISYALWLMPNNCCLFVGPRRTGAEANRESPLAKRPSCWPLIGN